MEWNIDPERRLMFDTLLANANTTYAVNSNKATKNAITSANKKVAFGELKHFLGTFVDYLEVNLNIPDAALEYMGLRPRHRQAHQPLPPPTDELVLSVLRQHDEITLYAARPEHDQPTASVGPSKHHGFMIRYKKEEDTQYQTVISTRLHHTLYFDHTDEGKRVFISAAWVNPRLEPGPWSNEISEIIG
jgi:hypothetical protein